MMPLHALTDGLVALAGVYAFSTLLRFRASNSAVFAAVALGLMGVAAFIGVVKFLTGWQDMLQPWHTGASRMGGITGMLLLGLAFWGQAKPVFIEKLPQLPTILIALGVYFGSAAALVDHHVALPLGALTMVVAIIVGVMLISARLVKRGILAIGIGLAMILNGLVINVMLPEPWSFHAFHGILAILIVLMQYFFKPVTIR